jgi:hypothetical protein
MRTTFFAAPAVLALAAAALPTAVQANSASQVNLRDFSISLIDLRPDDGIAPSIHFVAEGEPPFSAYAFGQVAIRSALDDSDIYLEHFNNSGLKAPFSDASGQASFGGTVASASLTAGPQILGGHHFMASGFASSPSKGANAYYAATATGPGYINTTFSLTPNTLVVFEGDAEVFASVGSATHEGSASGSIELSIHGVGPSGSPSSTQRSTDNAGVTAAVGEFKSVSRPMSVSFHNNSALSITGQLSVVAHASGYDISAPVPEPAEGALALAGLAVIAVCGRRRRQGR